MRARAPAEARGEVQTMERSPEAEKVLGDFAAAIGAGDLEALDRVLSKRSIRLIGTDPGEFWGPDPVEVRRLCGAQLEEMGGAFTVALTNPEGYGTGSVAWVADQPTLGLPDGTATTFRITGVLEKEENGELRFVQLHLSMGVGNVDAIGIDLST
jgi:ketosteroid isomerase-like protein